MEPGGSAHDATGVATADLARLGCAIKAFGDIAHSLPLAQFDEPTLRTLLSQARRAESVVASLIAAVAMQADALARDGRSAPGREFLLGDGSQTRGRRAGREAARAALLTDMPEAGRLLQGGKISLDHIDSLAAQLLPLAESQREHLDREEILADAARLPADTFARRLGRLVADAEVSGRDDSSTDAVDRRRSLSSFRHWFDHDQGMGHVTGRLDPERYEMLAAAIDQETNRLASAADGPTRKTASLAASALVGLITGAAGAGGGCGSGHGPSRRPSITVVVGPHGAETSNGQPLGDDAVRRLLCDADLQRVTLDDRGLPINVGRRHRTATSAQWAAIRAVYRSCAWDGCERPLSWCQLHHIHEWNKGGATDLHNLVPLCSEHHHRVHEGGWALTMNADRSLTITRPDGSMHTATDPPGRTGA